MKFASHDDGRGGEYSGIDFVEISKTYATQDVFLFGAGTFDGVES